MAKKIFTDADGLTWHRIDSSQPSDIILRTIALQLDNEHDVVLRRKEGAVWYAVIERE